MSLFTACGGSEGSSSYRQLYSADVSTLNYLNTTMTNDMSIPANTQEWLIQYDSLGNVQPALAESWETSKDGLKWTFKLREDAKWYDSAGEEVGDVVAQDFVNAKRICTEIRCARILYVCRSKDQEWRRKL